MMILGLVVTWRSLLVDGGCEERVVSTLLRMTIMDIFHNSTQPDSRSYTALESSDQNTLQRPDSRY